VKSSIVSAACIRKNTESMNYSEQAAVDQCLATKASLYQLRTLPADEWRARTENK
jgi:hypothetical protein